MTPQKTNSKGKVIVAAWVVPDDKANLEAEAKKFGLSQADIIRLKLRKPLELNEIPPWVPKL